MRGLAFLAIGLVLASCSEFFSPPKADPYEEAIGTTAQSEGFIPLFVKNEQGKVLALLPAPDEEGVSLRAIHAMRLKAGLGSNPIGLDRGWGNSGAIVRFRLTGGRVTAEIENHRYRATADNPLEQRAVGESFARSIIWSTPLIAKGPDGGLLVDFSSLLTQDLLGLGPRLKEDRGGAFSLDKDRSSVRTENVLSFPDNVEFDADLTFASSNPGPEVRATAPYPGAVTLTAHHTFARLPDDGYRPRIADPRLGAFTLGYYDYSAPLAAPVIQAYAMRHRLQHETPGDPDSPIIKPIVFHVDPGAPEAIRDALVEGASWWSEAFDEAGFPGGFRVEILPEDAHPLDIRYNVIQWVHRQTRGWSYGGGIVDPRTGEFLKGHVILGSQRVRQDRMIFEGLAGTQKSGTGDADDPVELALDRIRQLSAHEVAHALGFGHNFAASINNRASVADYPAPWVIARGNGTLDFSNAYDEGIGEWDKVTVQWLYGEFDPATEQEELDQVVADARAQGLLFSVDGHGRSAGTAHPLASVWDNGADPVAELENVMAVRRIALRDFDESRLATGRPHADLRDVLTPIYLFHRYQLNAAAKVIGGASYEYGENGEDAASVEIATAAEQRRAMDALISTLAPSELDLPEHILRILEPTTDLYRFNVPSETFASATTPIFDFRAAVETAADLTFAALLNARRAERLAQFNARDPNNPSFTELLERIESEAFSNANAGAREEAIARLVRGRYVFALIALDTAKASQPVKSALHARLTRLADQLSAPANSASSAEAAHRAWLAHSISSHLSRPAPEQAPSLPGPKAPPGSPIGSSPFLSLAETCWHCD